MSEVAQRLAFHFQTASIQDNAAGMAESFCVSRPFGTYPPQTSNLFPQGQDRAIVVCPGHNETR